MNLRRPPSWLTSKWGVPGHHPFHELQQQLNAVLDSYWGGLGGPTARPVDGISLEPQIDVTEAADKVTIDIEMPGVPEENIEVTFSGGILSVRGEKEIPPGSEDQHYALREREIGLFERTISIGPQIDADGIEARYRFGVLSVILPKAAKSEAVGRRIPIRGA